MCAKHKFLYNSIYKLQLKRQLKEEPILQKLHSSGKWLTRIRITFYNFGVKYIVNLR